MIRLLGFLTGVVVTGTALLLFTDEAALESARATVEQISGRLGAPASMSAESQSFAATPRPEELRAGPGWFDPEGAASETSGVTPDIQSARADRRVADNQASPHGDEQRPASGIAEPTAAIASGDDDATADVPASDVGSTTATDEPARPEPTMAPARAEHAGTGMLTAEPITEPAAATQGPARVAAEGETPPEDVTPGDGQWFAFWTPFRSRASAQGFATHLGVATGQEIRVLRMGPGEYRVAFFHSGEDERRDQLARLEQASGLKLGGEL